MIVSQELDARNASAAGSNGETWYPPEGPVHAAGKEGMRPQGAGRVFIDRRRRRYRTGGPRHHVAPVIRRLRPDLFGGRTRRPRGRASSRCGDHCVWRRREVSGEACALQSRQVPFHVREMGNDVVFRDAAAKRRNNRHGGGGKADAAFPVQANGSLNLGLGQRAVA